MASQFRWQTINSDMERLERVTCNTVEGKPIIEDRQLPKEIESLCKKLSRFTIVLTQMNENKETANFYDMYLSNFRILILIQILAGIGLGLELGKLRNRNH